MRCGAGARAFGLRTGAYAVVCFGSTSRSGLRRRLSIFRKKLFSRCSKVSVWSKRSRREKRRERSTKRLQGTTAHFTATRVETTVAPSEWSAESRIVELEQAVAGLEKKLSKRTEEVAHYQ